MKVAIIGPYPLPGEKVRGGVERVIDTLIQAITDYAEVTLIVPNSAENQHHEMHGARIIYISSTKGPGSLTYWTTDSRRIARILRDVNPDIVHYQGAAGIARRIRFPGVLTIHGMAHSDLIATHTGSSTLKNFLVNTSALLVREVERYFRRQIGNVIIINPYVVSALPDVKALRQFQIPNPLDRVFTEGSPPSRPRTRRIISVGRIGLRKQTARGVEIAARLLTEDPRASAVFFGEPDRADYLQECLRIAKSYGVGDRLKFPGNITADQLRHELESSDVFLMTSKQETAPVAIAEAHACGVTVVAPNAFGISNMIIEGVNGLFLPEARIEDQVAVLKNALEGSWDRESIAKQARLRYAPDIVAARTIEAYQSILGQN